MDFDTIDWNSMWQEEAGSSYNNRHSQKELWDKRADSFSQRIDRVAEGKEDLDKDDYISKMLARIEIQPDWTVLDLGCGPGTLAIPLARKARSVTALDLSSEMLRNLKSNAENNGLNNIRYLNLSWQEAFASKQIGKHDIVIASRSLMSGDMKEAISNIISVTEKAAYLTFPVVHLPLDWEIYKVIGRTRKKYPPYIYFYNLLYQMGITANVEILHPKVKVQFSSIEEAIERLQRRTDPFTPEEKQRLTEFLKKKFAEQTGSPGFVHEGYSKWALIWWKREIGDSK